MQAGQGVEYRRVLNQVLQDLDLQLMRDRPSVGRGDDDEGEDLVQIVYWRAYGDPGDQRPMEMVPNMGMSLGNDVPDRDEPDVSVDADQVD